MRRPILPLLPVLPFVLIVPALLVLDRCRIRQPDDQHPVSERRTTETDEKDGAKRAQAAIKELPGVLFVRYTSRRWEISVGRERGDVELIAQQICAMLAENGVPGPGIEVLINDNARPGHVIRTVQCAIA